MAYIETNEIIVNLDDIRYIIVDSDKRGVYIRIKGESGSWGLSLDNDEKIIKALKINNFIEIKESYSNKTRKYFLNRKKVITISNENNYLYVYFKKVFESDNEDKLTIIVELDDFAFDILKVSLTCNEATYAI